MQDDACRYVVFSKGRPERVTSVHSLVGRHFDGMCWLVAHGDKGAYATTAVRNVDETGRLGATLEHAVKMANRRNEVLVFLADDLRGFYKLDGEPSRWACGSGRKVSVDAVVGEVSREMRQVGAALGGAYLKTSAREQTCMPYVSYRHFCSLDFDIVDPPLNIHIPEAAFRKQGYRLTASVLAASGANSRPNHYSVAGRHYTPGGAGTAAGRKKQDARAAQWLIS